MRTQNNGWVLPLAGWVGALLWSVAAMGQTPVVPAPVADADASAKPALIRGLGESFPSTQNVSKSPDFAVYRFPKDGVTYVQINRLDGTVVAAVALVRGASYVLPIGRLAASQLSSLAPNQTRPLIAPAAGDQQCPCSAQVVYVGPYATVVVVTDRHGNVIQVVTIPHSPAPAPAPAPGPGPAA